MRLSKLREHWSRRVAPRLKGAKAYDCVWNYLQQRLGDIDVKTLTPRALNNLVMNDTKRPILANRSISLLSAALNAAIIDDLLPATANQTRLVKRFSENSRQRYLTREQVGAALTYLEGMEAGVIVRHVARALQLIVYTGARRGEIGSAKKEYWDEARSVLCLSDSKTGPKEIVVPERGGMVIARAMTDEMNRSEYLFPTGMGPQCVWHRPWREVVAGAGLPPDTRIHDLRHTWASLAASSGASLPQIAGQLGHKTVNATARYAHLFLEDKKRLANAVEKQMGERG